MNLGALLDQVREMDDSMCIFAKKPWAPNSEAEVVPLGKDYQTPPNIAAQGLDYFLEIHIAKEVLDVFGEHSPTKDEQRNLLIYYAENDAYPVWVYER